MPIKWSEVTAKPEFQALPSAEKEAARQQYFADVVAPRVPPDEQDDVRKQFDTDTRLSQDLPAGVTPSTAGPGRGTVFPPMAVDSAASPPAPSAAPSPRAPDIDAQGPKVAYSAGSTLERPRVRNPDGSIRTTLAPQPEVGSSVLDRVPQTPPSPTMSPAEYASWADMEKRPKPDQPLSGAATGDAMRATPPEIVAGQAIRQATGKSIGAAALQGVASGIAGLGKVGPGLLAAAADFFGPGVEALTGQNLNGASDFALGAAKKADSFSQSVEPQGGYYEKLVGNVFSSVVQNAPSLAFGLPGAAEAVGGKVTADVAAKAAMNRAMDMMFVQSASQKYADLRNMGFDPLASAATAAVEGKAEVWGERFGWHEQMGLVKAALGKTALPVNEVAHLWATHMVKDIPGEELTSGIEFLNDKYGLAPSTPKATLEDYFQQVVDTAVQTVGQSALMGAPAGIRSGVGGAYRRADAALAYDQAARQGFHVDPPETTDPPETQRKKMDAMFGAVAGQYGIAKGAVKSAMDAGQGMALPDVGGFYRRFVDALEKRNATGAPVDEHAKDVLTAGPVEPVQPPSLDEQPLNPKERDKLDALTRKAKGTPAETIDGPDGQKVKVAAQEPADLSADEGFEYRKLLKRASIPNVAISGQQVPTLPDARAKPAEEVVKPAGELTTQDEAVENIAKILGKTASAVPESIDTAAHEGATSPANDKPEPTPAQIEAGNYELGHFAVGGLPISIENAQGSTRSSKPDAAERWSSTITDAHYGYIRGTAGMDGDHVDTFVKPGTKKDFSGTAFVIDQVNPDGTPDEHKVMLGYGSQAEAQAAYLANYPKGWKGLGAISPVSMPELKAWLNDKAATTRPYRQAEAMPSGSPTLAALGVTDERKGESDAARPDVPALAVPVVDANASRGDQPGRSEPDVGRDAAAAHGPGHRATTEQPERGGRPAAPVVPAGDGASPVGPRVIGHAGQTPATKSPIELRPNDDGTFTPWHENRELLDFDSGEPVHIPAGATNAQAVDAIRAAGSFGKRTKVYGVARDAPPPKPGAAELQRMVAARAAARAAKASGDAVAIQQAQEELQAAETAWRAAKDAEKAARNASITEGATSPRSPRKTHTRESVPASKDEAPLLRPERFGGNHPQRDSSLPEAETSRGAGTEGMPQARRAHKGADEASTQRTRPAPLGRGQVASIQRLVEVATQSTEGNKHFTVYRLLDAAEVAAFQDKIGADFSGYTHGVDESAVRHVFGQHGNAATEASRGQLAITAADFERLAEITDPAKADEVSTATDERGVQTIVYRKRYNGTTYVVEEVREGRKRLALKTMWKVRTAPGATSKEGVPQTPGALRPQPPHGEPTLPVALESGTASAQVKPEGEGAPAPSGNTIFTDEMAAKARERLRKKLDDPKNKQRGGIDPEVLIDGITLAGYHVEKGARTFAAFSKAMLGDLGEMVCPFLKSWYAALYHDPRVAAMQPEMTPLERLNEAEAPTPAPPPQKAPQQAAAEPGAAVRDASTAEPVVAAAPVPAAAVSPRAPAEHSIVEHVTRKGKTLRGVVRTDLTAEQAGAIDDYTFKKDGGYFIREQHLGEMRRQDAARAEAAPPSLVDHLLGLIQATKMPAGNLALKKIVSDFDGKPAEPARVKAAQEALEEAIVRMSRQVVADNLTEGPKTTFAILQRLYASQPLLNVRTSTSVENQAYSTPAPLAYLASLLAGITQKTTVGEPTAGNGMLLIGADPAQVRANELNPERAEALKAQGFDVTTDDAAQQPTAAAKSLDAVITNPPFGGLPVKVKVDGYLIGQVDHLIAAHALTTMKDDGKAVLIIGANKVAGQQSSNDRVFLNWLYGHYNVTGHFEVDGSLYERQGAGWPVRVISINGRVASSRVAPQTGTIARATTWADVYGNFEQALAAQRRPADAGRAVPGQRAAERAPVSAPAAAPPAGADRREPAGSPARHGDVAGERAGVVDDRQALPAQGVERADRAAGQPERAAAEPVRGRTGDAERAAKPARDAGSAALAPAENQFQAKYTPRSGRQDEGVLIPVNMAAPTQAALDRLEDAVGDIDEFVRSELGFETVEAMHDALMGLQVDSVASAIFQMKQDKALVIADQTGIGKGRQAAALIRWAIRQDMTPIFVSAKPSLFSDMFGDLTDIGSNDVAPYLMNVDATITSPGGETLYGNRPIEHRTHLRSMAATGELPAGRNALFTTYSQVNTENAQRAAIMALTSNPKGAIIILDESHLAGGESNTGEFMRGALALAKGVTYLSATYAKRADNMPLYFRTDIGEAMADSNALMQAMTAGGLPLQTVVANNLVAAGQMFRRERSFDGVSIVTRADTAHREQHEELSDETTRALRAIVEADHQFHTGFVRALQQQLKALGEQVNDIAGNQAQESVDHTEFSSVVHNFVRQMLLGMKAQEAADDAIATLKRGEKPLIAVDNTMGSFLQAYAADNGIAQGHSLGTFDYRAVLSRALERSRYIVRVLPTGVKVKEFVELKDLDAETRRAYTEAQALIDSLKIDLPVSPIDWMRRQITDAGYSVAEITGRNLAVDYSDPANPKLDQVPLREQKDKVATTRAFNAGNLDVIILNVAGSTGISLHASERFADQHPRHMIVAQAAQDINVFMQMLGRIHRTGQVALPSYTLLSADLPAEKRPTALLSAKMKSLNANTSSNTESATSVKTVNMLNKYGDQVVLQFLAENQDVADQLGLGYLTEGEMEDVARKATGRLALLPVALQHQVYGELEESYTALMDYLNKTNQNDLEPRTFDFDAEEKRSELIYEGRDKTSPFGQDAHYGEYSVKAQGKPMTPEEMQAQMALNLDGKTAEAHAAAVVAPLDAAFGTWLDAQPGHVKAGADESRMRSHHFIASHPIGSAFRIEINGDVFNAVVTNIRSVHKQTGNPFAMSKVQVTVAVNGALRQVTMAATQFEKVEVARLGTNLRGLFERTPREERETAKIVTGNLLGAYGELKDTRGTIISFTKRDGTVAQGILLPRRFNFAKDVAHDYRFNTATDAAKYLGEGTHENLGQIGIASRDSEVRVLPKADGGITVKVPKSKARGGRYFLDAELRAALGDFVTVGSFMQATTSDPKAAQRAIERLMTKTALYAVPSMAAEARQVVTGERAEGGTLQNIHPVAPDNAADDSDEARALKALSENDANFTLAKSDKDTVAGIAADNDPNIKVHEYTPQGGTRRWVLTMINGDKAFISMRPPGRYGPNAYGSSTDAKGNTVWNTERPGVNPEDADADAHEVWIDVAGLKSDGAGAEIYNIAATLAHNTGSIFIGDPRGISHSAMVRRPEHMLASALKFGTTDHLQPHPDQVAGNTKFGVPPLRWVYGDTLGNIRRLIELNLAVQHGAGPHPISFDPTDGQFRDTAGKVVDRARIGLPDTAVHPHGATLAGSRTLARSAVLRALVRESSGAGEAGGRRDGLLARLAGLTDGRSAQTRRLFYDHGRDGTAARPADRLTRLGEQIARQGYERADVPRVQAANALQKLIDEHAAGEVDDGTFSMRVKVLADRMSTVADTKAANRLMTERQRGADLVREKLLAARRRGDLPHDTVELALWALGRNPALADNLGITVRAAPEGQAGAAGDYNPAAEIIRLFKGNPSRETVVHEILHHAERMMPERMQEAIRRQWARAYAEALKKATPEQRAALRLVPQAMAGNQAAYRALVKAIQEGPLSYAEHYQLVNPSEYWAVNGATILGQHHDAQGSIWQQVRQWLREMVQKARSLVGLPSTAPIIRALHYVTDASHFGAARAERFASPKMLSDAAANAGRLQAIRPGRQGLESRGATPLGRVLDNFEALGDTLGTPQQGLRDAASKMNIPATRDLVRDPMMSPRAFAEVNLSTGAIHWNPKVRLTRAEWAQTMAEELMHSVDHVGINTAISATSTRLMPGGDITTEAQAVFDGGRGLADLLGYPMNPKFQVTTSPERVAAELFARLAVIYHGDQALMRRELPIAYEAFHVLFESTLHGPHERLLKDVRRVGARGRADSGNGGRDASATGASGRQGNRRQGADHGLDTFRARIADIFDADEAGGLIPDGALEARTPNTPSGWRDATNRVQFKPGAWLAQAIGRAIDPLLVTLGHKAMSPELKHQLREMKLQVQRAQDTALAMTQEANKLSEGDRTMISDIIEGELSAGVTPPSHAVRLAALMSQTLTTQSQELVQLGMLSQEAADRWDGKYLPRFYEQKLGKQVGDAWTDAVNRLRGRPSTMRGIKGNHLKGRGKFETIAASDLANWEALGWEVRDAGYVPGQSDEVAVWRDFTRDERDKMGEIRDAGFRFLMGYMQTQKDLALGRMFASMAADPQQSSRLEKPGWVKVPATLVQGTGVMRYGKMAGRFVPREVMSHLSQIEEHTSEAWKMYRGLLAKWKEGKTALNPASHMNNTIGNLTMAHLAGVSYHRGDKYIGAMKDFAQKAPMVAEARDAGLFLGSMSDAELMAQLPRDLQALVNTAQSKGARGLNLAYHVVTLGLRKPLGALYGAEDTFFRYLLYKDARQRGVPPNEAVDHAQRYIFTYDDLPLGARRVRDFAIPFYAWTYKAVPLLLHTALAHPVRLAGPAAVLWALNAAGYALAAGDDDDGDWWERLKKSISDAAYRKRMLELQAKEQQGLPPWLRRHSSITDSDALGIPKAAYNWSTTIRMGTDPVTGFPVFADASRYITGGDMFDVTPHAGGWPLPAPITPSHPLLTLMVGALGNKDLWTGKPVTDQNDTIAEWTAKEAEWMWKNAAPAIAIGNMHWQNAMNAASYAAGGDPAWMPRFMSDDYTGIKKDGLPAQPGYTAANIAGVKVNPIDLEKSMRIDQGMQNTMIREIQAEMRQLRRMANTGARREEVVEREVEAAKAKIALIREGKTVNAFDR